MKSGSKRRLGSVAALYLFGAVLAFTVFNPKGADAAFQTPPPWQRGDSSGENLRVVLITLGPGDDIASYFGHSAVLVEDTVLRIQRVYNYGMFDFGPKLVPMFLKGRLQFWVGESSLQRTINLYTFLNRDIRMQELNLSGEQKERLAKALAENVLPENRYYLYDHYDDNCATRIRDVVDDVLNGQLREFSMKEGRMSLRDHTRTYSQHDFLITFGIMFLMNSSVDQTITYWDEMFLPLEMERVFAEFSYVDDDGNTQPLVSSSIVYHEAKGRDPVPEKPSRNWPALLLVGTIFGGGAIALARCYSSAEARWLRVLLGLYNVFFGILVGLTGVLLLAMWLFSEHTLTYRNENILLTNPLALLCIPLGVAVIAGSGRAIRYLGYIWVLTTATSMLALTLKVFPFSQQNNWMVLALFLPLNLGIALSWLWLPNPLSRLLPEACSNIQDQTAVQ